MQSVPFMMTELCTKKLHYAATLDGLDVAVKLGTLAYQKKHSKSSEKVY
jgi:hypothetical protein